MIVTLTPTPSIDRTVTLDRLVRGAVNRTSAAHVEASGKGVNVTRVLVARGYRSLAVVPAGGAEGDQLLALLDGIQTRAIATKRPVRVNLSVVLPGGETTKLNEPGAELSPDEQAALVVAAATACQDVRARWLVISGSLPANAETLVAAAVAAGHAAGAKVAVDTSGSALTSAIDAGADLIAPNTDELAAVSGAAVRTPADAVKVAHDLAPRALSLVSMGPYGAVLVAGDAWWQATPPPIEVVNTVGAGDALLAGFLAEEGPEPARLARAVAWGTSACLVSGTAEIPDQPVSPEAVSVTPGAPAGG
ncbi:1-phosphofructokinase family hexose kinase [Fodinicola acaciae]|uniref:1-phosphofructokinase family hexose kinase n=1 Tax=Fodinicola acaciae TaxID=2681555 RepID=UPI0013D39F6A|nr:1-phosphofructokinase family hexose kinase [Fodinicola acaciae]